MGKRRKRSYGALAPSVRLPRQPTPPANVAAPAEGPLDPPAITGAERLVIRGIARILTTLAEQLLALAGGKPDG